MQPAGLLWVAGLQLALAAASSSSPVNFSCDAPYDCHAVTVTGGKPQNCNYDEVLMMSDDTGWGDMGYQNGTASTPHLDEWSAADSAIRFERFYAGSPICSPTRASFLTGRTPWRDCIFNVEYRALSTTETKHMSLAAAAASKNYRTAHFGKWHLGSLAQLPHARAANGSCGRGPASTWCAPHDGDLPTASPLDLGFDTFVSTPQCAPSASANCACAQAAAPGPASIKKCNTGHYHGNPGALTFPCQQYYHPAAFPAAGGVVQSWPRASDDDDNKFLVDRFEEFVNASLAENKPFLAVIWYHSVHIPYISPDAYRSQYSSKFDENQADYYGALTAMDAQIGRIRAMLRTLGIEQDTLLTYTADNGPEGQSIHGYHGQPAGDNPGSTNGLRGRKRDLTEGGIREPGLLEWPGMITRNVHTLYPAGTFDLKPTVLDILGITPPADWPLDGTSLVPLIKGRAVERSKPMGFVWGMVYGNRNRTGVCGTWQQERTVMNAVPASLLRNDAGMNSSNDTDMQWRWEHTADELRQLRLVGEDTSATNHPNQQVWMEGNRYKLFGCNNYDSGPMTYYLYDLVADPYEMHDLSAVQPARVISMKKALAQWIASVAKSRGPTETNCEAIAPRPVPSHPAGPFAPDPSAANCTYKPHATMPGSHPVKLGGIGSRQECCAACMNTTWCVVAIYQQPARSCNMHGADDNKPLKEGVDWGIGTGRTL